MTRKPTLSLALVALVALAGLWIMKPATASGQNTKGQSRLGAWLNELSIDGLPGLTIHQTTNFSGNGHGGTYTSTDTTDFGLGGVTPGFDSPIQGAWSRTNDAFVTAAIYFSYDTAGTHVATVRVTSTSSLDPSDPDVAFGTWANEVFLPGMDPLEDEPVEIATGTLASRRITTN
jgi:hypothetical protein